MKISSRLMLTLGLASLLVLGGLSSVFIGIQHREQIALHGSQARSLAETIRSSTRHAMLGNHREDVERIIEAVGRQEAISDVRIFNKEGRIVYSSDPSVLDHVVDVHSPACIACHAGESPAQRLSEEHGLRSYPAADGGSILGVIQPIYNEPSCAGSGCHADPSEQLVLGVLDVGMPLDAAQRLRSASVSKAAAFALAAAVAVSAICWYFFRSQVARPVQRLVEATRTVASGDLTSRLEVRRNDELGELAESFNKMTARLVEIQSQLYRSDRLASVGKLAAGVAHEINNPLTGVLTHASLLLRAAEEGSEARSDLETIVRETKRCREIVKGLLDFARQVPANKTDVDVNQTVEWALDIVDHDLAVKNITVTRSLAPDLPRVRADSNQLVQVLLNLLVNASDAIGDGGGEIFVGTAAETSGGDEKVVIKVADTGCGMTAEVQERLFEPFFTTKENKGTGLGLPVVWGILEEHGATIDVHSQPRRGATFTIRLPVEGLDEGEPGKGDSDGP